jgi:phosphate transport system ATP-binding protein
MTTTPIAITQEQNNNLMSKHKNSDDKTQPEIQIDQTAKMQAINVNVWFGQKQVLHSVNLTVKPNTVTAIIGPSGCGKSTLLRCFNRMHELAPNAKMTGKILLDKKDIYERNIDPVQIRRRVGMVFQKPNPFPTMSIYDNVAAGLKLTGTKKGKHLDDIVKRSLEQATLWNEVKDDLKKPGTSISGGQQQRLCIARAIALQPEVILMDEPCSALDPIATSKIEKLVTELKQDYAVVIVTHNMQQASRISDYTAFMYLGKLVEFDETKRIFENPKNKLTENYITGVFG